MRDQCAQGLRYPYRQNRPGGGQLAEVLGGELGHDRFESGFDLPGTRSHGKGRGRHRRPAGGVPPSASAGMTQLHGQRAEAQPAARAGGQIDGPQRVLGSQAESVGGGPAARDDGLAPQRRKRGDRLLDGWGAGAEAGSRRAACRRLADPHELPGFGRAGRAPGQPPPGFPGEAGAPGHNGAASGRAEACSRIRLDKLDIVVSVHGIVRKTDGYSDSSQ